MVPSDCLAHLLKLIDGQRTTRMTAREFQLELETLESSRTKDPASTETFLRRLVELTGHVLLETVDERILQHCSASAHWAPSLLGSLAGQRATLALMAEGLAKSAVAAHSGERQPLKAGLSLAGALLEALLEHTATERLLLELLLEDLLPADTPTRRFDRSLVA